MATTRTWLKHTRQPRQSARAGDAIGAPNISRSKRQWQSLDTSAAVTWPLFRDQNGRRRIEVPEGTFEMKAEKKAGSEEIA